MKLKPEALTRTLTQATPPCAYLIYGTDPGRVSDTIATIKKQLEKAKPLNVRRVTAADVTSGEILIGDEMRSVSLLGDATLLHVTDAGDSLTKHIDGCEGSENLLVIEAGSLAARSSLRKLFESEAHLAAVACYVEEGRALGDTIRTLLSEHGLKGDYDAITAITELAGGNQLVVRQEIAKLALYKGNDEIPLSVDDVRACLASQSSEQLDAIVNAVFDGNKAQIDRLLGVLAAEGVQTIQIQRALLNYTLRMLAIHAAMQKGQPRDKAMMAARPPIFFKQKPFTERHLSRWTPALLLQALSHLTESETRLKSWPISQFVYGFYAALKLSSLPRKHAA